MSCSPWQAFRKAPETNARIQSREEIESRSWKAGAISGLLCVNNRFVASLQLFLAPVLRLFAHSLTKSHVPWT